MTVEQCEKSANSARDAIGLLVDAIREMAGVIATLRADNIKLAEQCNALRDGKPFADGASKNP
jgi:hypothetical protein